MCDLCKKLNLEENIITEPRKQIDRVLKNSHCNFTISREMIDFRKNKRLDQTPRNVSYTNYLGNVTDFHLD